MAPTVCIAEFPMAMGTTVSSRVRYRRGFQSGMKRRRFALESQQMLRTGTIAETLLPPHENCESRRLDYPDTISDCSVVDRSAEYATNVDEDCNRLVAERRRDLLSIVVRTIILVRRNRILQRRLNALRAETRRFLRSVLNNPESQQRRSQMPSHLEDSSSTEKIVSTLSPLLPADPTKNSFQITSRGNRDHPNDESSSSDKSEANRSEC
ncbi:PREDICTED: uncharacterized protein LOC108766076 isoform X2 [Trachymyrmex cornetzi]|uniref:Uncharacterized protein n=2 Tax=Trachymyrmex cornetzi TaxID=471704 RepID=A0A195DMV0_9HYME|nr:PREDICTED: uncharacterized protein LOC108766076 isoform X2 [Trachymyrmex cornetzi]KYN14157.1 hypothetical protein ALC57_13742 [Trachymyrmex cornetzi]